MNAHSTRVEELRAQLDATTGHQARGVLWERINAARVDAVQQAARQDEHESEARRLRRRLVQARQNRTAAERYVSQALASGNGAQIAAQKQYMDVLNRQIEALQSLVNEGDSENEQDSGVGATVARSDGNSSEYRGGANQPSARRQDPPGAAAGAGGTARGVNGSRGLQTRGGGVETDIGDDAAEPDRCQTDGNDSRWHRRERSRDERRSGRGEFA